MSRKAIIMSLFIIIMMTASMAVTLALSPVWMTVLMIRPQIMTSVKSAVTAKVMHAAAKQMFSRAPAMTGK